jgi:hypothetical protein
MPRNNGYTYTSPRSTQRPYTSRAMAAPPRDMILYQPQQRDLHCSTTSGKLTTVSRPPGPSRRRTTTRQSQRPDLNWTRVGGTAKSGFRTFGRGYHKFQGLYGAIAFGAGIALALREFNDLRGTIQKVEDECDHADVILGQLEAVLDDEEVVTSLNSDGAGRKLVGKLRRARKDIARAIGDLRPRVRKYGGEHLGIKSKIQYYIDDSSKVSGLRMKLRQNLDNLQDLVVWIDR